MNSLFSLERNDVEGAIRVRTAMVEAGEWEREYDAILLKLQDNPEAFIKRVRELEKALPRLSDDDRDKKVGAKPLGATTKRAGSNGKTRYSYPAEQEPKKVDKKSAVKKTAPVKQTSVEDAQPHPDLPQQLPNQNPISANPEPNIVTNDHRESEQKTAKHTLSVNELCSALGLERAAFKRVADHASKQYGTNAREKFITVVSTQLKEFAKEHGLDDDYFGLLFDVLSGAVPEGVSASGKENEGK